MPIRIGLDFGTAYTKLAIRVAGKVFFVDWSGIHGAPQPYLLSGELSTSASKDVWVGRAPDAAEVSADLKLPLLQFDRAAEPDGLARTAIFLAWALRYARAWLYRFQAPLLGQQRLVWEVNLGAPTGSWKRGDSLLGLYRRVGLAGWRLSQESELTVKSARQNIDSTPGHSDGWGLDFMGIVPEFAAQVAGYVKSPQRTDGLYLLADVGAGTLDVACFRIMKVPKTPQDRFPVFASEVEPLGAHYLMQAREHLTGFRMEEWNSTRQVPDARTFADATGVPLSAVEQADHTFERLVTQTVQRVLTQTRFVMEKTAPEWHSGMPVFFAGGGAGVDVYRRGIAQAFRQIGRKHIPRRFPQSRNVGASFKIDAEVSSRMSVAYGLTFDAAEIGELVPPGDIRPHEIYSGTERRRPDRDELYPK